MQNNMIVITSQGGDFKWILMDIHSMSFHSQENHSFDEDEVYANSLMRPNEKKFA